MTITFVVEASTCCHYIMVSRHDIYNFDVLVLNLT